MWKQISDLFTQLFTVTQRLSHHDDEIGELRQELKIATAAISRLVFEQARTNDELKRNAEREAAERKIWQLQLENQLLKASQALPRAALHNMPASSEPTAAQAVTA